VPKNCFRRHFTKHWEKAYRDPDSLPTTHLSCDIPQSVYRLRSTVYRREVSFLNGTDIAHSVASNGLLTLFGVEVLLCCGYV